MSEKISAVLIVKDEEEAVARCLRSLEGLDEIVVLDTGSSDNTPGICETLGARVVREAATAPFHFGEARNRALALVQTPWALTMDADEVLRTGSVGKIREALKEAADYAAFFVTFLHRDGSQDRSVPVPTIKIFRKDAWTWKRRVHELLRPTGPGPTGPSKAGQLPEVMIEHIPPFEKTHRRSQNLALLELAIKEDPKDFFLFRKLGQELMLAGRHSDAMPHLLHYVNHSEDGPLDRSQAMIYLGQCHFKVEKFEKAMKWFMRAVDEAPERREPLYEGALALIKKCRLDEALSWLDRLVAIPVEKRPMSIMDVPGVWGEEEPKRMIAFCNAEIARAKALFEEQQKGKP